MGRRGGMHSEKPKSASPGTQRATRTRWTHGEKRLGGDTGGWRRGLQREGVKGRESKANNRTHRPSELRKAANPTLGRILVFEKHQGQRTIATPRGNIMLLSKIEEKRSTSKRRDRRFERESCATSKVGVSVCGYLGCLSYWPLCSKMPRLKWRTGKRTVETLLVVFLGSRGSGWGRTSMPRNTRAYNTKPGLRFAQATQERRCVCVYIHLHAQWAITWRQACLHN